MENCKSTSNVVRFVHSVLSIDEVKPLLENPPKDKISELLHRCPKAREIYIYTFSDTTKKLI